VTVKYGHVILNREESHTEQYRIAADCSDDFGVRLRTEVSRQASGRAGRSRSQQPDYGLFRFHERQRQPKGHTLARQGHPSLMSNSLATNLLPTTNDQAVRAPRHKPYTLLPEAMRQPGDERVLLGHGAVLWPVGHQEAETPTTPADG